MNRQSSHEEEPVRDVAELIEWHLPRTSSHLSEVDPETGSQQAPQGPEQTDHKDG
jgi:hypothetical protein